jgi:hypothetical protein
MMHGRKSIKNSGIYLWSPLPLDPLAVCIPDGTIMTYIQLDLHKLLLRYIHQKLGCQSSRYKPSISYLLLTLLNKGSIYLKWNCSSLKSTGYAIHSSRFLKSYFRLCCLGIACVLANQSSPLWQFWCPTFMNLSGCYNTQVLSIVVMNTDVLIVRTFSVRSN